MGYIIKNTQGLIVTRLTDTGRKKLSEGNFNIAYFQVGDSEVNYNKVSSTYNKANFQILEPSYNAQNSTGIPASNKNDIKYPFYLSTTSGITYGIPFMASSDESVFNKATTSGFFSASTNCYKIQTSSAYTYNSQYVVDLSTFVGTNGFLTLSSNPCSDSSTGTLSANTYVTIYAISGNTCNCVNFNSPILTFRVGSFNTLTSTLYLDRAVPDLNSLGFSGYGRCIFTTSGITGYDLPTPQNYWSDSVINYESVCTPEDGYVKVWNMNIPWSESPAGVASPYRTYTNFPSRDYLSTKEYYGYMSSTGQSATTAVTYYNSFGEMITVSPEEQKSISIVHYTNNAIINFYGEKFAAEVYVDGSDGEARNFSITLPWLMWHKNSSPSTSGETFFIDPPGYSSLDLLTPYYIKSSKNSDMNSPGIRFYNLYDTHTNPDGYPSRVGRVFPDDKIIIFDDEEIIATMTYVANRNYTLPSPKLGLISPGSCGDDSTDGLLDNDSQQIWVSYGFEGDWQGMHCNYYQNILGPMTGVGLTEQNVTVSFGGDFTYMNTGSTTGFSSNLFYVIAQTGTTSMSRPLADSWKKITAFTSNELSSYIATNGNIIPGGMTAKTFTITPTLYSSAPTYQLSEQITIPLNSNTTKLGFGNENLFYGNINTDIQATIYEMRYLINLPNNQFVKSSNPTWSTGTLPYMSEIGLYDNDKNLLVLGKFQSPQVRTGIQQVAIKLDF
jgi:hypothetical protein